MNYLESSWNLYAGKRECISFIDNGTAKSHMDGEASDKIAERCYIEAWKVALPRSWKPHYSAVTHCVF